MKKGFSFNKARIDRRVEFIFFFLLFLADGAAASAAAPSEVIWWEFKGKNAGSLSLCRGEFPLAEGEKTISRSTIINNSRAWIKSPDGSILPADPYLKKDIMRLDLPVKPGGLYIVGLHLDAGVMDFDSDGAKERVHFYSNCLIYRRSKGTSGGAKADMFFGDPGKIALEIGPLVNQVKEKHISSPSSGQQTALRPCRMRVFYRDQPLANAKVTVLTEDGWRKEIRANDRGIFSITPLENKQRKEKYLYVVTHIEPRGGEDNGIKYRSEYHCATLMMTVKKPPPEWWSKSRGFTLWTVLGTGLFIIVVIGAVYHRRRLDKLTITRFEKHRVKRD